MAEETTEAPKGIFQSLLQKEPLAAGINLLGTAIAAGFQPTRSDSFVDFDARTKRQFKEGSDISRAAADKYSDYISRLGAQRYAALDRDYMGMIEEARKIGALTASDINRSFNAQLGAAGQRMISSGLANTTVAPGVSALVNRERANALSRAGSEQARLMTGLLGQRASALYGARMATDAELLGLEGREYGIANMLAQRLATPTQTQKKSGSFFEKVF